MARTNNLTNFLTDVATAIKTKKGDNTPIPASNFDTEITNLPSGGGDENATINYSVYDKDNSTYSTLQKCFVEIKDFNATGKANLNSLFSNCKILEKVDIYNTSSATNMYAMFSNCEKLEAIPSRLNTSNATNMSYMFGYCKALTEIPSNITFNSATDISSIFTACSNLATINATFNTNNVTNFGDVFSSCTKLVTAPNMNTSSGTRFYQTFRYCYALENVPVYDFSSATTLYNIFYGTSNLSDTALDNILQSCISATSFTGTKTLVYTCGFTQYGNYTASRIQALPHYQDFINAGWTIGY